MSDDEFKLFLHKMKGRKLPEKTNSTLLKQRDEVVKKFWAYIKEEI